MAVDADHGQLVDIGLALSRRFPRDEVVRFALGVVCLAQDAAAVADDEGDPLLGGGRADRSALPQHGAALGEQHGRVVADAAVVGHDGAWHGAFTNELGCPAFDLGGVVGDVGCLLYTSPSPRDQRGSRMPSSA